MKVAGVQLAPLRIPLERRIQTLATLQWIFSFLFLGFGSLFLSIILLFTQYYWITLFYFVWFAYDRNTPREGGREWEWVRNWKVWEYFRDYFPIYLIKTAELDPSRNYIFGYHPHGVMSAGAFCNFATNATGVKKTFPGIRPALLVLPGQFQFPFYRDYLMTTGVCDSSKASMESLLTQQGTGNAVVLVVGGAVEALEADPDKYSLNLSKRKGFIKIALRTGSPLVPVFSFGENELFTQVPNPEGSWVRYLQDNLVKILGFSTPFFHGRGVFNYTFGLLPFRRAIHTVVGAPIEVTKVANPSQEQIDSMHETYVQALQNLFEEHKHEYGVAEFKHLQIK